jgi:hypothetical protein
MLPLKLFSTLKIIVQVTGNHHFIFFAQVSLFHLNFLGKKVVFYLYVFTLDGLGTMFL